MMLEVEFIVTASRVRFDFIDRSVESRIYGADRYRYMFAIAWQSAGKP